MHKRVLSFIVILVFLSAQKSVVAKQTSENHIIVLNGRGESTTEITDGDNIRLQITLSRSVNEPETIAFTLGNASLPAGSCVITSGETSCTTDAFSALGWYWDPNGLAQDTRIVYAKTNQGETVGQSNPIAVKPRPVVLVHGFISNWQAWTSYLEADGFLGSIGLKGFAVGDGQVEGALNTGVITNPPGRTNSIAQNAEILGQYISNVKTETGAEMVDLVVHSMGGMISRYYIDRVMQERDVAQLIMLGSPMGGSDCSVLPAALGFFLPASIEIRESYMRGVFNQQITRRRGIQFYDLAGTAIDESFKSPCTSVPNDTVVSFDSINAIVLESSQLEAIHSDLTLSEIAFHDFVKPRLQKPAGSFVSQPDPAPVDPADSPLDFTRVYTGHVDPGESTDITINVEPDITVAAFALYDATRSVTTIVRGASGNVIELDPLTNGFIRIDDPSSLLYLGYGFSSPRPGPWNITIQSTEATPAQGADFAISVYFVGGAKLVSSSSTLIPQLGERVEISATVSLNGQPLEITQAQTVIRLPDGTVETMDIAGGQSLFTEWMPRQAGTHAIDVLVTARAPDGTPIERTDFLAIEVQPGFEQRQITLNLILLVGAILAILALIVFLIVRGLKVVTRKTRQGMH